MHNCINLEYQESFIPYLYPEDFPTISEYDEFNDILPYIWFDELRHFEVKMMSQHEHNLPKSVFCLSYEAHNAYLCIYYDDLIVVEGDCNNFEKVINESYNVSEINRFKEECFLYFERIKNS